MCKRRKVVDVIIPTYKPDDTCVLLIKRLLNQSYPVHEIHLIDTVTGIFPKELTQIDSSVKITRIEPEKFDHGGTRHKGAMESRADIIVYMTQDAIPANEYLIEELVKPFENKEIAVTYARQLPNNDCNIIERYTRLFNYPKESRVKSLDDIGEMGIKTYFCSDVCAAYRKSIYESLGGFEEKTIFNEDMIMAAKIIQSGGKIKYVAEAQVIHSHNYSCWQQFHRNFDLAVSQVNHPEIFQDIKSESEGIQLVKKTMIYLIKIKKPWLIVKLFFQSGFKYMGYWMGKKYKNLPIWVIKLCTMNSRYWEN